jgi:hypothetical protein
MKINDLRKTILKINDLRKGGPESQALMRATANGRE